MSSTSSANGLGAEELRFKLRQALVKKGFVKSLHSRLRQELIGQLNRDQHAGQHSLASSDTATNRLIAQHLSHHGDQVTLASFLVNGNLSLAEVQQASMGQLVHDWQLPLASPDVAMLFNSDVEQPESLLVQLLAACQQQLKRTTRDAAVDTAGLGDAVDAIRAGCSSFQGGFAMVSKDWARLGCLATVAHNSCCDRLGARFRN